ncbi:glutamyl-tRNA amidotransferase, partial [Peptococcaceae bacterium SCADC1_2_3]
ILYIGVSDCKMEEGSLRCDANVSVREQGKEEYGTKTEIKNMNSFKSLQRALAYEVERQIEVLGNKGRIIQETRAWDESKGITLSMRSKEEAHDYRYFPEPDLVPLVIDRKWVEEIRASLPELPDERKTRYQRDYGLSAYDAARLSAEFEMADFFEACVKSYPQPKIVSNWINGDLSRLLNLHNINIVACPLTPQQLGALLKLIEKGTISGKIAKTVFEEMFNKGKDPEQIIQEKGLVQISDEDALVKIVDEIITQNQKVVADYRAGKDRALAFLVGQVMKATRGKANPELVNRLLKEKMQ